MKFLRLFAEFRSLEYENQHLSTGIADAQNQFHAEVAKRISAEQLAVSRGNDIDWLRGELAKSQEARDAAISARLQSLDLVNSALLKAKEPEVNPTPEQLKQYASVQVRSEPATRLIRQATHRLIDGLQEKDRKARAPKPTVLERGE